MFTEEAPEVILCYRNEDLEYRVEAHINKNDKTFLLSSRKGMYVI